MMLIAELVREMLILEKSANGLSICMDCSADDSYYKMAAVLLAYGR